MKLTKTCRGWQPGKGWVVDVRIEDEEDDDVRRTSTLPKLPFRVCFCGEHHGGQRFHRPCRKCGA